MNSLKNFLEKRYTYPLIQSIEDRKVFNDRRYQKISQAYELAEKVLLEITAMRIIKRLSH